jgi:hypothetical protein
MKGFEPVYENQNSGVPTSGLIDPEKGKDVPGPSYVCNISGIFRTCLLPEDMQKTKVTINIDVQDLA